MTHTPTTPTNWHALERQTFNQIPCRVSPLLQFSRFGITLLRLKPTLTRADEETAEQGLYNAPGQQWRFRLPFSVIYESVFDSTQDTGVRERRVPLVSRTRPDEFYTPMRATRSTWMVVVRGRFESVAGKLSDYQGHLESGQAHFTPLIDKPDEYVEPPRHVQ